MSRRCYHPELDALRLFAFLAVLLYHSRPSGNIVGWLAQTGVFGLSLFLLLSAFLITGNLMHEIESTGTVRIQLFLMKRLRRVAPLYLLGIGIGIAGGALVLRTPMRLEAVLSMVLLFTNFYVLKAGFFSRLIDPLWSIALEGQFYLFVPFAARPGLRVLRNVYWALLMFGLCIQFRLAFFEHATFISLWLNSFVQFQFFAAGGLLALSLHNRRIQWPWLTRVSSAAFGIAALFIASICLHPSQGEPAVQPLHIFAGFLFALSGTIAIFLSVYEMRWQVPSLVTYLGKISFGLYVFHQFYLTVFLGNSGRPVLPAFIGHRRVGLLCALIATVLSAMLSFQHFERHFLYARQYPNRRRNRTLAMGAEGDQALQRSEPYT